MTGKTVMLVLGLAVPLSARVTVTGVVREDGTGRPLAAVQGIIEGTQRAGTRIALFRLIGYRPLRLRLQLSKPDSTTANAGLSGKAPSSWSRSRPGRLRPFPAEWGWRHSRTAAGSDWESSSTRRSCGDRRVARLTDLLRSVPGVRMMYYVEDPARPWFHRDLFELAGLEAVEVYRSPAEVPQEYGGASEQCGLMLLWSRRTR